MIYLNKTRVLSFRDASPFEASPRLQVSTMSPWFSWTPALLSFTVSRRLDFRVFLRRSGSCRRLGIATRVYTQLPWVSPSTISTGFHGSFPVRDPQVMEERGIGSRAPTSLRTWFRISGASSSSCHLTMQELLSISLSGGSPRSSSLSSPQPGPPWMKLYVERADKWRVLSTRVFPPPLGRCGSRVGR